ncbi:MAG: molybdopterin molybdotransferase MoeA [Actinomycetaceae bacterium]|nr:molybdopterin molybdotransferase MoeA [Actinomycetaceae bacterium]
MRKDHQKPISTEDYQQQLRDLAAKFVRSDRERVSVFAANKRVLAASVRAQVSTPVFDNSAMDGFAVCGADLEKLPVTLEIVGEQPAGPSLHLSVNPGQAVAIMTGAPIPAGADTVVQSELTQTAGKTVTICRAPAKNNIRKAGEDATAGETILAAGEFLGARELAAIASVGIAEIDCYHQLKVGVIATGDELVAPGTVLKPGQIYESNSLLLTTLASEGGYQVTRYQTSVDSPAHLRVLLTEASDENDVFILSGGVSVGNHDVVRNLLEDSGGTFLRVAQQPGKPQGYAVFAGTPILAFPGNPVASFVSFFVYGREFLARLAGAQVPVRLSQRAPAGAAWKSPVGKRQYVPARLEGGMVVPVSRLSSASHLVTRLAGADYLAVVPEEIECVAVGDVLEIMEI